MSAEYYISSTKYNLQERMTKRGKVYDVVFRIVTLDGIEKQKRLSGFANKSLAKQAYTDFVTSKCELVKNNPIKKKAVEKKIPTVDELIPEYIASLFNQNKTSSIYSKKHIYRTFVSPTLGNTPIDRLTKEALYQWQDEIWKMKNTRNGQYYSYKYLSNVRALFGTFLSWCETRYGYSNRLKEVQKPRKRVQKTQMKIWSRDQFEQFISVVDDPTYHALFTLLFYTGRRKGEALALSPSDIMGDKIRFDKSITRKTFNENETYEVTSTKAEKSHIVPVCKTVQKELSIYCGDSPFLFGGERPLGENKVRRTFLAYCEKAGIAPIRIHDLRHSFVSMLIHMGANFTVIADLISDTVEQVIKTYGHMYETDKQTVIERIG